MTTATKTLGTWAKVWGVPEADAPRYVALLRRQLMGAFELAEPPRLGRAYQAGLDCLRATGVDMTPLPAEAQRAFRFTCQHRMELFPHDELPGFVVYDGRAMYLGSAQLPMGAGPARHVGEGAVVTPNDRGRVRVAFAIPSDWRHVGLLAVPNEGEGWSWPRSGEGETWCDLAEYRLARSAGWQLHVREGWLLQRAEPLAPWARRLETLYQRALAGRDPLLARLYRNIAIVTIGELFSDGMRATSTRVTGPEMVAPGEEWSVDWEGGGYLVHEETARAKAADTFHPEWAAGVWAYSRYRVARALLSVPFGTVVGVRGDAIALTIDPAWADSGRAGALRRQGSLLGPLPAPRTFRELTELTRRAKG